MAEADPFIVNDEFETVAGAQPRARRDSLFLAVVIHRENGEVLGPAKVRNLSATGLMAECTWPIHANERIVTELRGIGQVVGRIAWVRNGRVGVAFDGRIDPKLARKPVSNAGPADHMPAYLRHVVRSQRFLR